MWDQTLERSYYPIFWQLPPAPVPCPQNVGVQTGGPPDEAPAETERLVVLGRACQAQTEELERQVRCLLWVGWGNVREGSLGKPRQDVRFPWGVKNE